jgi:Holliday junction resolvase-like predicted endonuclease
VGGPTGGSRAATLRQRSGMRGEALAASHLRARGWTILGSRVRVGRDEIDLVAIEPGAPSTLVVVEVRTRASGRFGSAEESLDRRKVARLYRAAAGLRAAGVLPDGTDLPRLPWRVDLLAVDDAPAIGPGAGGPAITHHRALEPR